MTDKDKELLGSRPVTQAEREEISRYLGVPLEELDDKVVAAVIDGNW